MFAYNPTTEDISGQIIGQGMAGAAATQAESMGNIGQNIGNALTTLAAAYGQRQGTIAKGKNFKKFMGMAGDTFGMDSSMFADMEDYDAGMMLENFGSWMPAMANAQLGRGRMDIQQQGQQLATDRMYTQEQLRREREIMKQPPASNSVFTGGSLLRGLFQPMPTTTKPGP